jgi:tricorn protease
LKRPGVNVKEGMLLLAVGGERVSGDRPPSVLLVNQAGQEVQLTVAESDGGSPRTVNIKTVGDERPLRYRDWVERNRQYVHDKTGGRVGYVHIPDMGPNGYAEFHRYFLVEFDHEGLIVDVRFNGGGHVSSLLLEKLARQRLGYDLSRWMGPFPYPSESVRGPLVALTDEHAGSDGDIFSHSFKLMKLGTLIGRRTWGGVIGIWPRNWLVDGTLTTQPEFSFWFKDVGWGVENYGTDPDIEVDITPQDYIRGVDTQLERAIQETLEEIERNPPLEPTFEGRPRLTLPG